MTLSVYEFVVPTLSRSLKSLDAIVTKAEAFAAEKEIDPVVLVHARLRPDMLPFVAQVNIATDTAKGAAARLTGSEVPSWPDDAKDFAAIHARIGKARDYLGTFEQSQFDGAEDREIHLKLPKVEMKMPGMQYLTSFVLPNFYFHYTTAYGILRFNGLEIGKRDFLGGAP